ncbi:MAG: arabinogalactan endo-1,4-beta-galactosidase [Prevotella sp.]|nr:arabinogalactan endo-1,4-beta-galactosidase [Prevotella sp.]
MKGILRLIGCAIFAGAAISSMGALRKDFALGGDISATTSMEAHGEFSYNLDGVQTENTQLMKDYGMDAIRLRVWVNPKGGWSSKEDVLIMAKRAKDLGMRLMIDFHYSDWWADPGKQNIPEAWKDCNLEQMCDSLASHTRSTLQLLKDNDIDVEWVQVGNETTNGFLWPMGNANENMANYALLTQAGYDAVKEVYPEATVIVHLDNGWDKELYNRIFDGLRENGAKWDQIGMSLYPYWTRESHPEFTDEQIVNLCTENIRELSAKYGTDVMVVEVGVEAAKPVEGKKFMDLLLAGLLNDTAGHCTGLIYWAPECDHGYPLGAFQNRRPTIILDSFKEAAEKIRESEL